LVKQLLAQVTASQALYVLCGLLNTRLSKALADDVCALYPHDITRFGECIEQQKKGTQ